MAERTEDAREIAGSFGNRAMLSLPAHSGFYLASFTEDGELISLDGPHDQPEGVARAMKLYHALGFVRRNPWRVYRMLRAEAVPDMDPPINEEAAATCRSLMDRYQPAPPTPDSPSTGLPGPEVER